MPDERLAELLRQRALLSQHVAWLDAEIARVSNPGSAGFQPAPESIPPAPKAPLVVSAPATPAPASAVLAVTAISIPHTGPVADTDAEPVPEAVALANKRADEIIANYAATDRFDPESTRRGCILLASAVFLIGAATLIGIYLLNYR
jgi:hypothetical protein